MVFLRCWLVLVAVLGAQGARSQAAPPLPPASAASQSERMERAMREAARTLQVIQRAGLIDARGLPTDKAAAKAPVPVARPGRAPGEPAGPVPAAAPARAGVAQAPGPVGADAARAGEASQATPIPVSSSAIATVVLPPSPPQEPPPDRSPDAARPTVASGAPAAVPAMASAPPSSPVAARVPLRLVTMVEPDIPGRLLARLSQPSRFGLVVDVREDGSVAAVELRSGSPRSFEPMILAAVRQWRYAPTGQAARQAVDLVIKPLE
jgi:hypothetical protein